MKKIESIRNQIDAINHKILDLLTTRSELVTQIGRQKRMEQREIADFEREEAQLEQLFAANRSAFSNEQIRHIFVSIFQESRLLQYASTPRTWKILNLDRNELPVFQRPFVVAGPCAVETRDSLEKVARFLQQRGIPYLRGGAFKPRTSPYSFQGIGREGLRVLQEVAAEYGLKTVSEITDPRDADAFADGIDVLQIGSRNMQNFVLLREVGQMRKPVILKRNFAATLEEFLAAAEYIASEGNTQICLCERGIRTFESSVRATPDLASVALLKQKTQLPVIVDISHSLGRKDIAVPVAKAALALGADGLMCEVHSHPDLALSDSAQQMNLYEFSAFYDQLF